MPDPTLEVYTSAREARIYRIPLRLFPGMWGFAHLVIAEDICALLDVGSGLADCNQDLQKGLRGIREKYAELARWHDLTHILISHGHIDHFGGLPFVRQHCDAPVGIHSLDLRVLTHYEQRLEIIAGRLQRFFQDAGVDAEQIEALMGLYLLNKYLYASTPVDFTFESIQMQIGPIEILHVPGHCPGQVVFLVDDILLSADHVLQVTSPHQAPERLSLYTGLGHYLESLLKIRPLSETIRWVLGGHEAPVENLAHRIDQIMNLHRDRLMQVLDIMQTPSTVAEVAQALFPEVEGYDELLALEEAGAHVEFLALRGFLTIANVDALAAKGPVPIQYERWEGMAEKELFDLNTFGAWRPA